MPVTVNVYVPVATVLFAFTVIVDVPLPVTDDGLNPTDTPRGAPESDKLTVPVNPETAPIVTVSEVVLFRLTVTGVPALIVKSPLAAVFTVRETIVEWTVLPAVPVTVIVYVPGVTVEPTFIVIVEDPVPEIDAGLKPTVTPDGCPEADSETAEPNPPVTVLVILDVPKLPCATETEEGKALSEKSPVPVTVSETVVVSVAEPAVPVTVMLYVPAATLEPTLIVIVELPVPVIDDGLKPTVTPVGCPDADNETAELSVPVTVLVIEVFPALPGAIETALGEADRLKLPVELAPARAVIKAAPFGLPHPVARS